MFPDKNKPDALWAVKKNKKIKKKPLLGKKNTKQKKNACMLERVGVYSWVLVVVCVFVYMRLGLGVVHVLLVRVAACGVPGPSACFLRAAVCLSCLDRPVSVSGVPNLVSVVRPPGCSPSRLFLDSRFSTCLTDLDVSMSYCVPGLSALTGVRKACPFLPWSVSWLLMCLVRPEFLAGDVLVFVSRLFV